MGIKTWFKLEEAAKKLSVHDGDELSPADVARLAEVGRLPVCFEYVGALGVFRDPTPPPFHEAERTIGFNGYLESILPPSLMREENVSVHAMLTGMPASGDRLLIPDRVRIRQVVAADPSIDTLDMEGPAFIARAKAWAGAGQRETFLSVDAVPAGKWLFHVNDLAALGGDQSAVKPGKVSAKKDTIRTILMDIKELDPEFSPETMPGQKADFFKLCQQVDPKAFKFITFVTFDGYLPGLCKFCQGARPTNYYLDISPRIGVKRIKSA